MLETAAFLDEASLHTAYRHLLINVDFLTQPFPLPTLRTRSVVAWAAIPGKLLEVNSRLIANASLLFSRQVTLSGET